MLQLQPEQLALFSRLARERFLDDEVQRLRRLRPAEAARANDAALLAFVERALERAQPYGIVGVSDVQRFIELTLRLGPAFEDETRWQPVCVLLEDTAVSARIRLDRVDALLARQGVP